MFAIVKPHEVANKAIIFIIPPATLFAGVYSDPYVRPFVRSFVRTSLPISNPLLL